MTIKENGDVSLTSKDLVSQNAFTIPHDSPPNDRTEIKKTVLENGELKLFDASNNLIRSIPGQSISLPVVASELKNTIEYIDSMGINFSNVIACLRANVTLDSLVSIINNPPQNVFVTKVNDDVYTLRIPFGQGMSNSMTHSYVTVVDITNNLLLGIRTYDDSGEMQQCLMYKYDNCIITGFRQEVREELPDCQDVLMVTNADISNLQTTIL